ncbi:MAG: sporulation protein YabP [Clostridiaceae bacterium]|jgi:sporulation protein YabP|nr:sporulation protein YabP [Clostridiaceae bacterium]
MAEDRRIPEREHQNITLRDRRRLLITGVHNVESFNEECIVVDTELGIIVVRGLEMHINKLDVESAALDVEGEIGAIEYLDQSAPKRKGGFLSGLFR